MQAYSDPKRANALKRYQELAARVNRWRESEEARAKREAEAVVGMPFHGCAWHNATIAFESGKPWQEFGRDAVKAYKRLQWRWNTISATSRRLSDAFYARCIADAQEGGQS